MSQEKPLRPLEFLQGRAKVLAFPNSGQFGVYYNFVCKCLYNSKKTGRMEEGTSFGRNVLPALAISCLVAHQWYSKQIIDASGSPKVAEEDHMLIQQALAALRQFEVHRRALFEHNATSGETNEEDDPSDYQQAA